MAACALKFKEICKILVITTSAVCGFLALYGFHGVMKQLKCRVNDKTPE